MRPKVALFTLHPAPYRLPFFAELARSDAFEIVPFIAYAGAEQGRGTWRLPDESAFPYRALPSRQLPRLRPVGTSAHAAGPLIPSHVWRELYAFAPDLIVYSEFGPLALAAQAYAVMRRVPLALMTDATEEGSIGEEAWRRCLRRILLARTRSAFVVGETGRRYLTKTYGFPSEAIFHAPFAADPGVFRPAQETERLAWRQRLGMTRFTFLFAGRFVGFKGVAGLIAAFGRLPSDVRAVCELWLIGDGPLREALRTAAQGVPGIRFLPLMPPAALREHYVAADCLVLPSVQEVWGLVTNEALQSGTPVLVSTRAGSAELVTTGVNGWRYDPLMPEEATRALACAYAESDARMRAAAVRSVADCTPQRAAAGALAAIRYALDRSLDPA